MTGFLDLSREIRDMIYDLCLVVDSVIVPFSEYYPLNKADDLAFRYHMPTITLLGVSKLVEAEAVEVLYGKNVWRVTSEAPYLTNQPDCPDQWWARRAQLFKHVVMVFDQRDVEHGGYRLKVYHEQLIRVNSQQGSLDERTEAIETMDEIAKSNMEETWAMKLEQYRQQGKDRSNVNIYIRGLHHEKEEDVVQKFGFLADCNCEEHKAQGLENKKAIRAEDVLYFKH